MKTISVINHKGGSGKTSSTINIGAALAKKKHKVLLVDLDAQANLTTGLGFDDDNEQLFETMLHLTPIDVFKKNDYAVIPGSLKTADLESHLFNVMAKETRLKKLLNPMKNDFDFCLIDCPPSLTALTINAMVASDHLLIPVNALYFSYTAIESINTMYHSVKSSGLNPNLNLLGMFVTQLNSRRTVEKSILNSYKNDYPEIFFDSSIRTNVAIPESQTPPNCTDIFEYAPKSNGAKDYNKLTNELLKRLK